MFNTQDPLDLKTYDKRILHHLTKSETFDTFSLGLKYLLNQKVRK